MINKIKLFTWKVVTENRNLENNNRVQNNNINMIEGPRGRDEERYDIMKNIDDKNIGRNRETLGYLKPCFSLVNILASSWLIASIVSIRRTDITDIPI